MPDATGASRARARNTWQRGWTKAKELLCLPGVLLVQEPATKEAPGCSIVKVEVAIGTEVFAREKFPMGLWYQPCELLVRELLELLRCDRSSDSKFDRFHGAGGSVFSDG